MERLCIAGRRQQGKPTRRRHWQTTHANGGGCLPSVPHRLALSEDTLFPLLLLRSLVRFLQ